MTASLSNLANAAMQKNTAMDKLIQQNSALTSTIADMTLAMANMSANYVPSYEPGCVNPENLDETALIDTAASITLLTLKAPTPTTANANVQISIIQPGGNKMVTSHAVNLLLRKLPTNAKNGHRLPGLVNNLLSVATL